jgi:cell division protease FtsH
VESAHQRAIAILTEHREGLTLTSEILLKRETIEKDEFVALLDGKTEEDVFGPDESATPPPNAPVGEPERAPDTPRPFPRPGLAGGSVEARGLELPEKPEPA